MNKAIRILVAAFTLAAFGVSADQTDYWLYDSSAGTITDGVWVFSADTFNDGLAIGYKQQQKEKGTTVADFSKPVQDAGGTEYLIRKFGLNDSKILNNSDITEVIAPASLTDMAAFEFEKSSLASLTFTGGTYSIPDYCCRNVTTLQQVHFEGTVTRIGDWSLQGCTALKEIYFGTFPNSFNSAAIAGTTFTSDLNARLLLNGEDESSAKTSFVNNLDECSSEEAAAYHLLFPGQSRLLGKTKSSIWLCGRVEYVAETVEDTGSAEFDSLSLAQTAGGFRVSYDATVSGGPFKLYADVTTSSGTTRLTVSESFSGGAGTYDITSLPANVSGSVTLVVEFAENITQAYAAGTFYTGDVSISALQNADGANSTVGEFVVARGTGATDTFADLTVNYTASGSAVNGTDYELLTGAVTIPAGESSAKIAVKPYVNDNASPSGATVMLTLGAGNYDIGTASSDSIALYAATDWWTYDEAAGTITDRVNNWVFNVAKIDGGLQITSYKTKGAGTAVDFSKPAYDGSKTHYFLSVGQYAFMGAGIKTVTLPNCLSRLEELGFRNSSVTSVEPFLPDSLTYIGGQNFWSVTSLENETLTVNNATIGGEYAFRNTHLKEVVLGENASLIGTFAFQECGDLEKFTFKCAVTKVPGYTFASCPKLKEVVFEQFPTDAARWDNTSFNGTTFSSCPVSDSENPVYAARFVLSKEDLSAAKATFIAGLAECTQADEAFYLENFGGNARLLGKYTVPGANRTIFVTYKPESSGTTIIIR